MPTPVLQSVEKAFGLLEAINTTPFSSTAALTKTVGMPRASVQRTLNTLEALGYIQRDPSSKRYSVSDQVLKLSAGYGFCNLVADVAKPFIASLSEHFVWPILITYPQGLDALVVTTTQTDTPFAIQKLNRGHKIPLIESATGRIFLACVCEDVRTQHYKALCESGLSLDQVIAFRADVQLAERQGHFIFRAPSDLEKALAVPIRVGDSFYASLVVRFIGSALSEQEALRTVVPHLKLTADKIAEKVSQHRSIFSTHPPVFEIQAT